MRDPTFEDLAAAVGAKERARVARVRGGWWVAPTIIGGIACAPIRIPVLLFVVIVAGWVVSAPFAFADEQANSHPLTPGRWEAAGGEYWVDLRVDHSCSVRLPDSPPGASFGSEAAERRIVVESECTWTFEPAGTGTYGQLALDAEGPGAEGAVVDWSPWIAAGGMWGGGYNWRSLNYAITDIDSPDLTLRKVADY